MTPTPTSLSDWHDEAYRRAAFASLSRPDLASFIVALPDEELLAVARTSIARLGVYRVRLTKQERLRGKIEEPQTLEVTVQEEPLALRAEFVEGSAKGRRILYGRSLRAGEMRVREKGLLGAIPIWLGMGSALARFHSNHDATDLSFGALLAIVERDLVAGKAAGGHARNNVGFEGGEKWTTEYIAPAGCSGLYAQRARLTMDLVLGLPVGIEIHDAEGLLERYRYELLDRGLRLSPDFFTLAGAGL